jgi:peptidoglycan hydrolase-like protein with peptidoglycan-binding domain
MKKNKYLPYVLFGVPILIGVYFVLKNLKVKGRNQSQEPETQPSNPVKDAVNVVKDAVSGYTPVSDLPFKKGQQSTYIQSIQQKLGGLTIDGKFGSKTEASVKSFQKAKNLTADGIVGKNTWRALFGVEFPQTFSQSSTSVGLKTTSSEKTDFSIRPKFSTTQSNDWI